jgi:hypothetical protein
MMKTISNIGVMLISASSFARLLLRIKSTLVELTMPVSGTGRSAYSS